MEEPTLIRGGLAADDRGDVSFVNDFAFPGVKRFYMVQNHARGFVRAWHGHKKESKYVLVVKGAALVCAVQIDDWDAPSRNATVHRYVLDERTPAVLCIPAGHANGFMSLTDDAKIMFFSTTTLEEAPGDDFRFDARYWDPWGVEER
jgi:dTDP-4-dehydrorhamnose 3,5-epimerase